MKNQIQKDKKKRECFLKFENKNIILKSIVKNTNLIKTIRWNAGLKLTDFELNAHKIRLVNRCILTSRKNRFNKSYKFSRLVFLKFVRNGYISGLKKLSW